MTRFPVSTVGVAELPEDNCLVAVFADDPDEPQRTFELQVPLTVDEQDRSLDLDTYSLTVDGGATVYGGVRSCVMRGDVVELLLTADAAAELGLGETITFDLRLDDALRQELRAALGRIFDPALPQAPVLELR